MIFGPAIGDRVRVHYRKDMAPSMPYHGCEGTIVAVSQGRKGPRNIAIEIGPETVVIPAGNLVRLNQEGTAP